MIKKLIVTLSVMLAGALFLPAAVKAEDLTLVDKGNGFYLPATFNLKASDGSMLKSPKMDPSLWEAGTPGEGEELALEDGKTARKWWIEVGGVSYPCVSVYDQNGDEVYRAGRNRCGELTVYLKDEEGNTLLSDYTKYEMRYQGGKEVASYTDLAEPRSMEQFDAAKNVTHYESYTPSSDAVTGEELPPIINAHDAYWDENGAVKNNQLIINGEVASTWDDSDAIVFDDFEYTIKEPVTMTKQEWKMLEPCYTEGDTHICPSYTTALAGQPLVGVKVPMLNDQGEYVESIMYFTEPHLQIMEDENVLVRRHVEYPDGTSAEEPVIYYDVILKHCPLYLYDELFASETITVATSKKAEEMFQKQEELQKAREEAIIRGSERRPDETETLGSTEAAAGGNPSMRDGDPVWTQKIVGDVVPINGKVPETMETWDHDGHILVTLRDADGGIVASADFGAEGKGHTDYKYVYFTELALIDNGMVVFRVEGTDDAGMGGNLGMVDYGTTDTDQGPSGITQYIDTYEGP